MYHQQQKRLQLLEDEVLRCRRALLAESMEAAGLAHDGCMDQFSKAASKPVTLKSGESPGTRALIEQVMRTKLERSEAEVEERVREVQRLKNESEQIAVPGTINLEDLSKEAGELQKEKQQLLWRMKLARRRRQKGAGRGIQPNPPASGHAVTAGVKGGEEGKDDKRGPWVDGSEETRSLTVLMQKKNQKSARLQKIVTEIKELDAERLAIEAGGSAASSNRLHQINDASADLEAELNEIGNWVRKYQEHTATMIGKSDANPASNVESLDLKVAELQLIKVRAKAPVPEPPNRTSTHARTHACSLARSLARRNAHAFAGQTGE